MLRLTTSDGDVWDFEELEEAKKSKYIFGGKIEEITENVLNNNKGGLNERIYK